MADPRKETLQALETLEKTYQALRRAAQSQAQLLTLNGAKCVEIRQYNLLMMATYNAQAGWMELLRVRGVVGLPDAPPFPTLFAMQGMSGQEALNIDCTKLPAFVGPAQIRIVTSDSQLMVPGPEVPKFNRFQVEGLEGVFIPILIAGVVIAVLAMYMTSDLSADAKARQISADSLKKKQVQAQVLEHDGQRRADAMQRCMNRVKDPSDPKLISACASGIDKAFPKVPTNFTDEGTPIFGGGLTGTIGKIAIVAAVAIAGAAIYKRVRARRSADRGVPLPAPRSGSVPAEMMPPALHREVESKKERKAKGKARKAMAPQEMEDWGFPIGR